ncbi:MAG: TrkH family potassium uptake protein [Peptococcaceae bacterium]|nr:TrkH family potassium uptake protein [Peptococcaceae bacterium]
MALAKSTRRVLSYLGLVSIILGLSMLLPMLVGIYDGEENWYNYGILGAAAILGGYWAFGQFREEGEVTARDGYMLVAFTWLLAGVYGALPFLLHGAVQDFGYGFFEAVSGFTTTGATVFSDVESLERSLLLWRSLTHWLGGMGIVALFVAITSFLGSSGMQMFKAETTGPIKEKVVPRIKDTAKILWLTYVAVTIFQIVVLILLGMPVFDAVCHAFGAVATGGFSTKNNSITYYQDPAIEWAITFFMIMSGVNFSLYYLAAKKRSLKDFWKNEEFRLYLLIITVASLICTAALCLRGDSFFASLRHSFFQVGSMITTTGYYTQDFDLWPAAAKLVLVLVPFVGGCAGSTGGGIKVGRFLILFKNFNAQLRRLLHPRAVINLRVSDRVVGQEVVQDTLTFFFIYAMVTVVGTAVFSFLDIDLLSAFSAAAACLNDVGPGLGLAGPTRNFGQFPEWVVVFSSFLMLIGRLELYTIILLFTKNFWTND